MPAKIIGEGPNPTGLCRCGCGGKTTIAKRSDSSTGNVVGTPYRYLRGHWNRSGPDFHVDESGCWIWQGHIGANGYGYGHFAGSREVAHRGMYEQAVGDIPEGMQLDHLCGNRACVNPDHLEPVTPGENTRRGSLAKLTADDVRAIRASSESRSIIAAQFGISTHYVNKIRNRTVWAELDATQCACCGGTGWIEHNEEAA